MKKALIIIAIIALLAVCGGCGGEAEDAFPQRDINGIVQWGEGGGTDQLMRPLAELAASELGVDLVVRNMTGAAGSIATQYVYDAAADGYTLLMGAENPALYQALNISQLTYADFDCLILLGNETVGVIVAGGSPYQSFGDLIKAALARPGELTMSTTGAGGLPWEAGAFIHAVTGAEFKQIPYDSDATARLAVLSGECDLTVCKVQSGLPDHQAGSIRFLTMLALETVAQLPEVPLIIEEYPDFAAYLPWGPFYGVFVKKGVPEPVKDKLSAAFLTAAEDEDYQRLLAEGGVDYLGYSGGEAAAFIEDWQSDTLAALRYSGALEE